MPEFLDASPDARRIALRTPAGLLAFGFGAGLSRYAPGTVGTLVAVPFGLLLKGLPPAGYWAALALLFGLGVYVCGVASRALGRADPGGIVWDEMVGYWLAIALVPVSWAWWLAAFVLFRVFDIWKPWPIRQLERRVGGGLGVMLDDAVAAGYVLLLLEALQYLRM